MSEEDRKVKQVIVTRKDLLKKCRKGKLMAQASHASLGALLKMADRNTNEKGETTIQFTFTENSVLDKWLNGIFTKIALGVENDEEMVALFEKIKNEAPHIPCALITDRGLTEFHGEPTNTCVGIGPWWSDEIDEFTRELSLV